MLKRQYLVWVLWVLDTYLAETYYPKLKEDLVQVLVSHSYAFYDGGKLGVCGFGEIFRSHDVQRTF
jgi:hypothetical protein